MTSQQEERTNGRTLPDGATPKVWGLNPDGAEARLTLNLCRFSGGGVRELLGPSLPYKSVLSMGSRNAVGSVGVLLVELRRV